MKFCFVEKIISNRIKDFTHVYSLVNRLCGVNGFIWKDDFVSETKIMSRCLFKDLDFFSEYPQAWKHTQSIS